jgi:hypothetical protein
MVIEMDTKIFRKIEQNEVGGGWRKKRIQG